MRIHVAITTYKRRSMLYRLIESISIASLSRRVKFSLYIYDDDPLSSVPEWIEVYDPERFKWKINHVHRGKKNFWRTINDIFSDAEELKWDYFFLLQDDLVLEEYFFQRMIDTWNNIDDSAKICLNPLRDSRADGPNWTNIYPVLHIGKHGTKAIRTGWVDCIFMCERKMLMALEWDVFPIKPSRWAHNSDLSSGVGQQISTELVAQHWHPYVVYESLAHHGDHESIMNPKERKNNPLIG